MSRDWALRLGGWVAVDGFRGSGLVTTKQNTKVINSTEDQYEDASRHPHHEHPFEYPNGYNQHG